MRNKVLFSAGYFVLLIYIVFWAPWRIGVKLTSAERLRLHPIVDSVKDLANNHGKTWWSHAFFFSFNFFGNIFLFIPFSFVMMWVFRMTSLIKIALLGCLLSLSIEIIQYYTETGVADADDVLLNTAGAVIGFYLCRFFQNKTKFFIHR